MAASIVKENVYNTKEQPVLKPLHLPGSVWGPSADSGKDSSRRSLGCLLCDDEKDISESLDEYLTHILEAHKLVIADVNLVANFRSYCLYWKERFKEQLVSDICAVIQTTETKEGEGYYLLSDVQDEDRQLREFLQKKKLEYVLAVQQREREDDTFSRSCLFCREHFTGNRASLFQHMADNHGFHIGQPDNLVFTNDFLDILEGKLSSLQCLYCEKVFRDKLVLKEHMRKKQHRKINSKNQLYDRFYIINYLELGKNWEKIQRERDTADMDDTDSETEDEWSGWEEAVEGQAVCLYCDFSSSNAEKLHQHMLELHDFDLHDVRLRLNLCYYQQVKLINYIRRQVHLGVCIGCEEKFDTRTLLLDHMHHTGHTNCLPDVSTWDQPQYYFPTYENDNLLCQLEDEEFSAFNPGTETVIAEDTPHIETILSEEKLRKEILTS